MANTNQITTMRLPDGSEVAFVDWSDTPLWSSADFLQNFTDTEIDLFQYTSGEPVPATQNFAARRTSSDSDTNIATPGSMASNEEMLVYAVRPEIMEFIVDDVEGVIDAATREAREPQQPSPTRKRLAVLQTLLLLTLEVSQKFAHRAPLAYYNTGFGPNATTIFPGLAAAGIVGQAGLTAATAGFPTQEAVRSLVVPVHIGGQEKYRVRIENVTGAAVPSGLTEANPAADLAGAELVMHTIRVHLDGLYKRPVS